MIKSQPPLKYFLHYVIALLFPSERLPDRFQTPRKMICRLSSELGGGQSQATIDETPACKELCPSALHRDDGLESSLDLQIVRSAWRIVFPK